MTEKKLHKVYVYGTLRPNKGETVKVPGFLYDLGWYPGIILKAPDCASWVDCEIIEVDDERLSALDVYEGYYPEDHSVSLYIRRPYLDGWIYEYNRVVKLSQRIFYSDWLKYKADREKQLKKVSANSYDEEEAAA